ncbi:hypothetical protein PEp14_00023 [Erwinia phage PEp14]|uniref:Uncharacterized protein n=1 Tax=Erwinia phage PEp14 TaxID=1131315 RepID=H2DE53_9CAUD|nr:hypothetical protein PEp14_00023 [Erwinia phage PEp14]AEY69612.1 hypothetical protein PEp14_00023 [Erwinia phage PEp14]
MVLSPVSLWDVAAVLAQQPKKDNVVVRECMTDQPFLLEAEVQVEAQCVMVFGRDEACNAPQFPLYERVHKGRGEKRPGQPVALTVARYVDVAVARREAVPEANSAKSAVNLPAHCLYVVSWLKPDNIGRPSHEAIVLAVNQPIHTVSALLPF